MVIEEYGSYYYCFDEKCNRHYYITKRLYNKRVKNNEETCIFCNKKKSHSISNQELELINFLSNNNVKFIHNKRFGKYSADFFFPDKNLIIEIFGDVIHVNPTFFNERFIKIKNRIIDTNIIREKDRLKINYLKSLGLSVMVFYESITKKSGFKEYLLKVIHNCKK
jgi:hypothetical protein